VNNLEMIHRGYVEMELYCDDIYWSFKWIVMRYTYRITKHKGLMSWQVFPKSFLS